MRDELRSHTQAALCRDVSLLLARTTPSAGELLELVHHRLSAGPDRLALRWVVHQDVTGLAPREVALGDVPTSAPVVTVPLALGGVDLGSLVVAGDLAGLAPGTLAHLAGSMAVVLRLARDQEAGQQVAQAAAAVRRLFRAGARTSSLDSAGEVLARATAEAFGTELAAVHLVDADGRIQNVLGAGLPAGLLQALRHSLVGCQVDDSPVWRRAALSGGPVLVDDSAGDEVRPCGFIQTLELTSYVALPLMSAGGAVGMAVCGDRQRRRAWTGQDRAIAQQLALEGALVVDSARLRAAERRHVQQLTHLAFHDSLTGLANRARLLEQLDEAVAAAAVDVRSVALLLLDLDGFKQVNDTLGHHAGDVLLRCVAQRLSLVADGDLVARLGGDEFAVLLVGHADRGRCEELVDRIQRTMALPFDVDGQQLVVGCSIGYSRYPDDSLQPSGLLRAADDEMYRTKPGHASRGRVRH